MRKKVWINLDPNKVDVSYLEKCLKDSGFDVIYKVIYADDEAGTIELGNKVDAVVSVFEQWNERTLPAVKDNLKFIQRYGAGIDNINLKLATEVGIPVANVPGANSAAVAELALLHILNLGRRFKTCIDDTKKGIWPCEITGNELDGKTVGLVGFGNIAKQLARMMSGFDVKILVYDSYARPDTSKYNVEAVDSMEELFSQSDIVSLHIPLNKETKGIIDKSLLSLMKPSAYLVNTCRGAVINEEDLIDILREKKIRGAGLDVLSIEPPSQDNPLLSMDNVFVTSHMGAETAESGQRSQKIMADTIEAFFSGKAPSNIMNKELVGGKHHE
jgi:D-3-phosphoglycerate dehydrogenase